jgi:hypothetical protein
MVRSKLKRGKWAEPHDPMQIYISGPTLLVDRETGIRVGTEYMIDGYVWTATRILDNRIEFQQNLSGAMSKRFRSDAKDFQRV